MPEFILVGVILILGLGAYWALVLFPRQRAFTKRQKLVRSLSQGDEVITYGGLIGKVVDVDPDMGIAKIEVAEGIIVRIIIAAVVQEYDAEEIAQNAQIGLGQETSHES